MLELAILSAILFKYEAGMLGASGKGLGKGGEEGSCSMLRLNKITDSRSCFT